METDLVDTANDLISFLDSEIWYNFKQIIPNSGLNVRDNLIDILYHQIIEGKLTIENIFQRYSYNTLADSFISSPNLPFLHLCLTLYSKLKFIEPFLENIFVNSPTTIINSLDNASFTGNYDVLTNIAHISVFLLNYNDSSSMKIREILIKIPIEITLKETFSFASSFNKDKQGEHSLGTFNIDEFSILLQTLYSKSGTSFWNIVKTVIIKEDSFSIELIRKSLNKAKEYQSFMNSVPMQTNFISNQLKIQMTSSISKLIQFFERTGEIDQSLTDLYKSNDKETFNYLVKSIEYTSECSETSKLNFLNKLRSLKMISSSIEIEELNLNLNLNDKTVSIDQIIEYMERSKVGCEQFASNLFNVFHLSYMKQTDQTMKSFVDQFYKKYLKKLQFQTLDKLAEIAIDFLKSDLIQQHRLSLSALAIRLPISKYVNKLFFNEFELKAKSSKSGTDLINVIQKNILKEISIIENLHLAAIQTCTFLKLNARGYLNSQKNRNRNKSQGCSLNIISCDVNYSNSSENSMNDECTLSFSNSNLNQTVTTFDYKLLLRLRWRTLRDDTSCILSFLPEFVQMCESDEKTFLRWESGCSYPTGTKRNQILMKLGLLNDHEIIPSLFFELMKVEDGVDDSFIEILNPTFSNNIDLKMVKIPERPNISVLFRFNFLWCTAVLCHPKICEILRNPTVEISLSLLRSLLSSTVICDFHNNNEVIIPDFTQNDEQNNKYFDQLFTTFPLAFSAILSNSSSFNSSQCNSKYLKQDLAFISKFKKPSQILQAEQILNGIKKPLKNMQRYLVISVSFEFAKRKNLLHLADIANNDQLWIFFCFFFSITFSMFDVSVTLLKKFTFLFDYLHKGVSEENLFAGPRKWTKGLIQFSKHCSDNNISFDDRKEWILFNNLTQNNDLFGNKNDDIVSSKKDEWMIKAPINDSTTSSPLSSQTSTHEANFGSPQ